MIVLTPALRACEAILSGFPPLVFDSTQAHMTVPSNTLACDSGIGSGRAASALVATAAESATAQAAPTARWVIRRTTGIASDNSRGGGRLRRPRGL